MSIFANIEAFITTKVWPFIRNVGKAVVKAEVDTLEPIAVALVAQVQDRVVQAATAGSLSGLGDVLGDLVKQTALEAEKKALGAGATSLLAAIGTALATNTTTAQSLAVAPPQ